MTDGELVADIMGKTEHGGMDNSNMDFNASRNRLRDEIDEIDNQLLDLLNSRAKLALKVGRLKKDQGVKLFDPQREEAIVKRMIAKNAGPLGAEATQRLFERIIDEIRHVERVEVFDKKD